MDESAKQEPAWGTVISGAVGMAVGSFLVCLGIEAIFLAVFGESVDAVIEVVGEKSTGKLNSTTDYIAYYEFTTPEGGKYSGKQSGYVKKPREGTKIPIRYFPAAPGINRGLADTSGWLALLYAVGAVIGFGLGFFWIRKPPVVARLWLWIAGTIAAGPVVYLFINLPAFVPGLDI